MTRRLRTLLVITLAVVLPGSATFAQSALTENTLALDESAPRPQGSIDSLAWLAGSWRGQGLGGEVEEIWSRPSAGSMMGGFKLSQKGEPTFYEMILLLEDDSGLTLKLKHFNPDFSGWEEKDDFVTFPLVKLGKQEAYFRGLTYKRVGDQLHVFLALRREDGLHEMPFVFDRVAD